jgi:DNA-binding transcriptional MerR regulator
MTKDSEPAYRAIGDVAESLDLPQHVLRFWETRFKEIEPLKRAGGRRYYRPRDVELVAAIRHLLYGQGYTIKGVQRLLKEKGARAVIEETRGGGTAPPPAAAPIASPAVVPPWPLAPAAQEPRREAATPLPQAAAPMGRGLDAEAEKRLRAALAELAECRRLLTLTRR